MTAQAGWMATSAWRSRPTWRTILKAPSRKCAASGKDISHMASVASFFVSRVDTLVDKLLEDKIKATSDSAEQQRLKALEGKGAIANARIVYQEFKSIFGSARFQALNQHGAFVQRP